jgi:hypothetical protein
MGKYMREILERYGCDGEYTITFEGEKALTNKERCRFLIARDANDKNLYIAYVYMVGF